MGSARARKRRNRALEAQFEKTHRRRAQFAPGTAEPSPAHGGPSKRQRPDDGLSRDMRKMLSMKRAMESRKRKGARADPDDSIVVGSNRIPRGDHDTDDTRNTRDNLTRKNTHGHDERGNAQDPTLDAQEDHERKRHRTTAADRRQTLEDEDTKQLSASKQRKKEYMRNKKKGKSGKTAATPGQDTHGDEHDIGTSQSEKNTNTNTKPTVAFGEQVDAPMKEVLRSKHWAEKPGREGIDPAVSIVGLGAQMGKRRVAGMDSQAIAALYRSQKKSDGDDAGRPSSARATLKSLKQLVAQGKGRRSDA